MTAVVLTAEFKTGGVVVGDLSKDALIDANIHFEDPALLARVSPNVRFTVNLGNYESVALGGSITIPCGLTEAEVAAAFRRGQAFLVQELNGFVDEAVAQFPRPGARR